MHAEVKIEKYAANVELKAIGQITKSKEVLVLIFFVILKVNAFKS